MTLPRTIKRREKRQRAKSRPKPRGHSLQFAPWLAQERLNILREQLRCVDLFSRKY